MNKIISFEAVFICIILITFLIGPCMSCVKVVPSSTPYITEQYVYEKHYNSIVKIVAFPTAGNKVGISGTAFAITDDHFLTSGHFCKGASDGQKTGKFKDDIVLIVTNRDGDEYNRFTGKIVAFISSEEETENDICLIESKRHGLTPLKLASFNIEVEAGDIVVVEGSPLSFQYIKDICTVIISSPNSLVVNCQMLKGNSGSPVIWNNQVIGMIVQAADPDAKRIGFAASINLINTFLKKYL